MSMCRSRVPNTKLINGATRKLVFSSLSPSFFILRVYFKHLTFVNQSISTPFYVESVKWFISSSVSGLLIGYIHGYAPGTTTMLLGVVHK